MAKLNGVKTIDMVNGEITKVSYGGAEYVAVEGNGQIGDLALCKREHAFFTKGEFYEVIEISGHGTHVHAIDDEYDRYFLDVTKSSQVFRKVSAEQSPTIDERVSKLEAEVADLKGERAVEAPYIPQEGDIVVITGNDSGSSNAVGDIGKVVEVDESDAKIIVPGKSDRGGLYTLFEELRKATPTEVAAYEQAVKDAEKKAEQAKESAKWTKIGRKPGEFKKGDIVRVVKDAVGVKAGEIHVVYYHSRFGLGGGNVYFDATETNVAVAEKLELVAPVESLV